MELYDYIYGIAFPSTLGFIEILIVTYLIASLVLTDFIASLVLALILWGISLVIIIAILGFFNIGLDISFTISMIVIAVIITVSFLLVWFKDRKEHQRIEEEKKERERKNEEEAQRQRVLQEQFVQKQKALGLVSFTDRNGREYWEMPEEIEKIKQKDDEERIKESLLFKVIQAIEEFKPTKQWGNENNYHIELLGWLRRESPDIVGYEVQSGGSRPDLVIKNIAIEIKGPTDTQALNTLTTKILKYSLHYEHVIIVLFETNFSESNYQEIIEGFAKHFPHVKVIRKS
jgi:hypothetical protein